MAMNQFRFQKGLVESEFVKQYGRVEQCHAALLASRWPEGFVCPHCGKTRHSTFIHDGRQHWQCQACRYQTTVTAGTIFQATKLPLTLWFLAMHLLTQAKNNVAALELMRHPGVSYKTAWLMKLKLLQVMMSANPPVFSKASRNAPLSGRRARVSAARFRKQSLLRVLAAHRGRQAGRSLLRPHPVHPRKPSKLGPRRHWRLPLKCCPTDWDVFGASLPAALHTPPLL